MLQNLHDRTNNVLGLEATPWGSAGRFRVTGLFGKVSAKISANTGALVDDTRQV